MRKLVVVLLLVAFGACGDDTSNPTTIEGTTLPTAEATEACTDRSGDEGQAGLELRDFAFAPTCLQIDTAQGLRLHNEGEAEHNFSVEGVEGLDVDVAPGEENNTEATGLEPGTFTIFCEYHRDSHDMEAELRVAGS